MGEISIREVAQSKISGRELKPCTFYIPETQCLSFLLTKIAATSRISGAKGLAHTNFPNTQGYSGEVHTVQQRKVKAHAFGNNHDL